ncbi:hypothetical protein WOSG25_041480 [Weissella oryzae SG25]|uniref:Uncharacterized protein n=1 Tax=Weissella oryzae (strain DSM 25784 / JCM 18191 / LMG 30913 / SG25) TaxID=1329250 RepID=A0A069CTH5_WEIOS|nr:hypothetical protein [Weissella oryzae]GAK30707.1 hypothetical protein WOSG25_041480 [Weissella oryzae SG25]
MNMLDGQLDPEEVKTFTLSDGTEVQEDDEVMELNGCYISINDLNAAAITFISDNGGVRYMVDKYGGLNPA